MNRNEGTEHPLLLKGPLVRRTLDGRKWMTRRLPGPGNSILEPVGSGGWDDIDWSESGADCWTSAGAPRIEALAKGSEYHGQRIDFQIFSSYAPGETIWFRECWQWFEPLQVRQMTSDGRLIPNGAPWSGGYGYQADLNACGQVPVAGITRTPGPWRSGRYMPREACRIEREIISVRAERLQDITDDDIRAEGVSDLTVDELLEMGATIPQLIDRIGARQVGYPRGKSYILLPDVRERWKRYLSLRDRWRILWDIVNGHRPGASWTDNPVVWVIEWKQP